MRDIMGKVLIGIVVSAATSVAAIQVAQAADNYPQRPITIVVPTGPGGAVDINSRIYAAKLTEILGQPVVVENRAGGGSLIGTGYVANSAPDGYTLLATTPTITIAPSIRDNVPYDPIDSFEPVVQLYSTYGLLGVRSDLPVDTVNDYIEYARENPGAIRFAGTGGLGGINHMWGEWLHAETDTEATFVGYQGGAEAMGDMMAGRVDATIASVSFMQPYIETGSVKPLAIGAEERTDAFPDVPTVAESGVLPEFNAVYWVGFFAPAGTPAEIVEKLNDAFVQVLATDEEQERMAELMQIPVGNTPAEFAEVVQQEVQQWKQVVEKADISLD